MIFGKDTSPLYEDAFDTVSVSLNASNAERYQEICHPVYGKETFSAIIAFAENVNKHVQNVLFSVVKDYLSEKELRECYDISSKTCVPLRVRDYIPPAK